MKLVHVCSHCSCHAGLDQTLHQGVRVLNVTFDRDPWSAFTAFSENISVSPVSSHFFLPGPGAFAFDLLKFVPDLADADDACSVMYWMTSWSDWHMRGCARRSSKDTRLVTLNSQCNSRKLCSFWNKSVVCGPLSILQNYLVQLSSGWSASDSKKLKYTRK